MMRGLIGFALRQRVLVMALALLLVILGLRAIERAPLDVFPEFAPPLVEVQTEAPGLSTEEVESLISIPLENAVNGVAGLKTLRSRSVLGLSSVVLIFQPSTDLMLARQLVQEKLAAAAAALPSAARAPVILPPLSSTSRAMKVGLTSKTLSQAELSELVRWTVRPRLMGLPGVANVAVWGHRERQLQVLVSPDRLAATGVLLDDVVQSTTQATAVSAGGFVDTPNQRMAVQQLASIDEPNDLSQAPVRGPGGAVLRLGDVAEVVDGHAPPIGDAVINDGPGLLLIVEKQPTGNTLDVSRRVEAALQALKPALPGVEVDTTIFRPATFVETSLNNLAKALALGCLLVVIVLVLFLYEWRSAVISITAIPLSLVGSVLVLSAFGYTMNTMVIAGLVIALGEIVDDAIIDVENITRRLRLNRDSAAPRPVYEVVLQASLEVRSAVVFASMIIVLVFVPILFMEGLGGAFFRPLALSYMLAIGTSLFVALTVTPAMCLFLLPGAKGRRGDSPLVVVLKREYRKLLPRLVDRPRGVVIGLVIAFVATAAVTPFLGQQFLPNFKERDFLMHFVEKPGTSLEAMRRITVNASKELRAIPGVRNFGSHIGRAEAADEVVGPNFTELWISMDPKVDYDETLKKVQTAIDGYPGLRRDVLTYLRERIKEVLTGASATVVVRIYGPDMAVLRDKAQQVRDAMATVPGVADLQVEQQALVPQIQIRLRPEAAAYGLSSGEVRRATGVLIAGQIVGEVYQDQRSIAVSVWGDEAARADVQALRALTLDAPNGEHVRLGDVADVLIAPAPNEIRRENASRRIDVTANVPDADLGTVARAIEAKVGGVSFAQGYYPEFLGEYAALKASQNRLMLLAALSFLGVLILLHAEFKSPRLVALIALSLPFALVGGVAGVLLSGGVLSLGSLVGFIAVLGIAARNGIMLISHYQHLEHQEGVPFGPELILRGAEERLAPILMTAACAALALLPLVIRADLPGHEIEAPMAVVILGGLVTSTILNLFLTPVLYAAYARGRKAVAGPAPVLPAV